MRSVLVWFRRDLRHFDHAALHHALRSSRRVHCAFIFDTDILESLPTRRDRRVEFIHASVRELDGALRAMALRAGCAGAGLIVRHGRALDFIPRLASELGVGRVVANRDYEPSAIARDVIVARRLADLGIEFADFKDQVIFEREELMTQAGRPFRVFTPYRNAWLKKLDDFQLEAYPVEKYAAHLAAMPPNEHSPTLAEIGFATTDLASLGLPTGMTGGRRLVDAFFDRIDQYRQLRDYPALEGASFLSTHLRFGTVSIRELAARAHRRGGEGACAWLSELVWRDFYQMILYWHPHVVDRPFRDECRAIEWDDAPVLFAAWCEARTGYPIVDAAMRQLHQTGYMHNRLRMIVASFLTKDLGVDWRMGERHFAAHLNDYDLAANNGGWQWAASTGCDAQPWFRIFNPVTQSRKFDPQGRFIRRYLPELSRVPDACIHAPWTMSAGDQAGCAVRIGADYPGPIVDHAAAREHTLKRFRGVFPLPDRR